MVVKFYDQSAPRPCYSHVRMSFRCMSKPGGGVELRQRSLVKALTKQTILRRATLQTSKGPHVDNYLQLNLRTICIHPCLNCLHPTTCFLRGPKVTIPLHAAFLFPRKHAFNLQVLPILCAPGFHKPNPTKRLCLCLFWGLASYVQEDVFHRVVCLDVNICFT